MKSKKIVCQKVYKVFSGRTDAVAISDVSMAIDDGELVALTGPNGSGKTTLLKLIMGIHKPSSGRVIVNNSIVSELSEDELSTYRTKTVGMIFQDFGLIDFLTVQQNLEVPLVISGITEELMKQRIKEMAERLGITHLLTSSVDTLSGGEKQRVSIGVGLVNNPEIILADEPTANLDRDGREDILDLLLELKKEGKTILLVTHEEPLLEHVDRVYEFDKGYLKE